jgi:hypothetical protein
LRAFYEFFNDSFLSRLASDGRMTDEWWIEKDLEGTGRSLIGVLSRNLPGGTENNRENPQNSRCHGRDSNLPPPGYHLFGGTCLCLLGNHPVAPIYMNYFIQYIFLSRHVSAIHDHHQVSVAMLNCCTVLRPAIAHR